LGQFHWDPSTYLELMRAEVPDYERLQDEVVAASRGGGGPGGGGEVFSILELGTGTGETARRLLAAHAGASLHGIDASEEMLSVAREVLSGLPGPSRAVRLDVARLEDALPSGPFDLVVSVLAIHHLDAAGKADLFRRVAGVLRPGGRFVLGDVIVPDDPRDVVTPVDGVYDQPSSIDSQLDWLGAAGFDASVAWRHRDLAVLVADAPARPR
jgi:tRNA (cmo5U34)-methyltransferase